MRLLSIFLLSLDILAAGCSAPKVTSKAAPAPSVTLDLYQPDSLVETQADAVAVAGKLFTEKGGVQWIGTPSVVFAEEMSYEQAQERIGVGEGQYDRWARETQVWLVIFKGQWQLMPLAPSQAAPTPITYDGCGFILFTAREGEWMAMGDAVCPP